MNVRLSESMTSLLCIIWPNVDAKVKKPTLLNEKMPKLSIDLFKTKYSPC